MIHARDVKVPAKNAMEGGGEMKKKIGDAWAIMEIAGALLLGWLIGSLIF